MSFHKLESNCLIAAVTFLDNQSWARTSTINKHWYKLLKLNQSGYDLDPRLQRLAIAQDFSRPLTQLCQYKPGCLTSHSMLVGERSTGWSCPSIQVNNIEGQLVFAKIAKNMPHHQFMARCGHVNIMKNVKQVGASVLGNIRLLDCVTGKKLGIARQTEEESKLQAETSLDFVLPSSERESFAVFQNGRIARYVLQGGGAKCDAHCVQTAQLDQAVAKTVHRACLFQGQVVMLCKNAPDKNRGSIVSFDPSKNEFTTLIENDPDLVDIGNNSSRLFILRQKTICAYERVVNEMERTATYQMRSERTAKELGSNENAMFYTDFSGVYDMSLTCNDRYIMFPECHRQFGSISNGAALILQADTIDLQDRIAHDYNLTGRVSFYRNDMILRREVGYQQVTASIYDLTTRSEIARRTFKHRERVPGGSCVVGQDSFPLQVEPLPNGRGFVVYRMDGSNFGPMNFFKHTLLYFGPPRRAVEAGCCYSCSKSC